MSHDGVHRSGCAAFLSLLLEALDELLTRVVESGNRRLDVLPLGHNKALLQEEMFETVNAFLARASVDGMSGYAFMLQKYRDDIAHQTSRFSK